MSLYQDLSDEKLVELMVEDEEQAFNVLYNRYWDRVLQVAAAKVGDVMEAENMVQDIFVSIWKRRNLLDIQGKFENYLLASVKYKVIKFLNRQRAQRLYEADKLANADLLDDSTQESIDFREFSNILEQLVGKLPERSQLVFRMNKLEGKSYKEIAEFMGITERAVDACLVRLKKTLRSGLGLMWLACGMLGILLFA